MFKSVFTKYITTFTLIIAICFLVLTLIISAMLKNYSIESKELSMQKAAQSTSETIDFICDYLAGEDFDVAIQRYSDRIQASVASNASYADADIYVIDKDGRLLISSTETEIVQFPYDTSVLPVQNGSLTLLSDLSVFDEVRRNYLRPIYDSSNTITGVIIISSSSISEGILTSKMTSIIIAASLWVFLAALLALYNLSKNISEPLTEISNAAKSFSIGHFDVRVKVKGRDEIAELGKAFNTMAESLALLEQTRSTFIANVSHDLRTPMTTIAGFVDGIIDGTIPPDKQEYYLSIIANETKRLSRLINSLLEVSRLDSRVKNITPTNYNLSEQARQIIISFEQKINDKRIEVDFDAGEKDIFVWADKDAMHQVMYNICDNAVKFTNDGGKISINIEVTAARKKKAKVTVRNTGQGIPPEDIPFVFERFYKTDRSRSLDKLGVGLGLYIVKAIIAQHGEDITVSSTPGEYCEFTWYVPLPGDNSKKM